VELYFHSPNTPSWSGAQLKRRDNFTFHMYRNYSNQVPIPEAVYITLNLGNCLCSQLSLFIMSTDELTSFLLLVFTFQTTVFIDL
jgi:hypothetical protein